MFKVWLGYLKLGAGKPWAGHSNAKEPLTGASKGLASMYDNFGGVDEIGSEN